jgi:hypothetical protein
VKTRYASNSRKPKTSATFSRREKGIEYPREIFLTDSPASVTNPNDSLSAFFIVFRIPAFKTHFDKSFIIYRFNGIDYQVEHSIFDLRGVDRYHNVFVSSLKFKVDSIAGARAQLCSSDVYCLLYQLD